MLAAATLTLAATDGRNDDIDMQPDKELTVEAVARAYTRSLEGLPDDESEAKKRKFVEYIEQERQVLPPQAALRHDLLRPQPAGGLSQGTTAFIPCQDFGWRRTFSSSVTSKNNLDNSHGQRHSVEIWTVDIWSLQETQLPGIEHLAAAQCWAEVVDNSPTTPHWPVRLTLKTMVAAAKERQQSAASLVLDLAKFYERVGHDHLWEEGRKTSFPKRLLAGRVAVPRGRQVRHFPLLGLQDQSSWLQWRTTAAKLTLASLLETVTTWLPTYRLWNVVHDFS